MPRVALVAAAAAALAACSAGQSYCYGPGERNQGESGYPAVDYRPCCDGRSATRVYGQWGFFCPGGDPVTDTNCYKPGERNQGEAGYPAVQYKPCCDGKGAVTVYGQWGKFCPGGTVSPGAPAPAPAPAPSAGGDCYKAGERNQGASGYPAVPYKPCCSGKSNVEVAGEWGRFCPGAAPKNTDSWCYKPGERNQGEAGYPAVPYKPCCDGGQAKKKYGDWGFFCPGPTDPEPPVTPAAVTTVAVTTRATFATQPPPTSTAAPPPTSTAAPPPTTTAAPPPTTQGVCEGIGGVRPNADPISDENWNCYESGVLALVENGVWQRFADFHRDFGEHNGALFLVWHRAMLWELEKELNAVQPGCRIPAYDSAADNTGVFNSAQSQLFTANRAGTCGNLDPFSGIGFSRNCDPSVGIFGTGAMNNAITGVGSAATGTETDTSFLASYEEFNNWIEGVHGNFHVAVGGSMGSIPSASLDPVFYMHHAYIDKVWRQWQNARGGNDFGGERNTGSGDFVDSSVVMEPWGMTAADVIERISGCVDYENENGPLVTRMEVPIAARQGNSGSVRRDDKGTPNGYAAAVVPVVEEETKDSYQLQVAEEKIRNPKAYEQKVLNANRKKQACVDALRTLGVYSEVFIESWQRLEGFRLLALERIDLADVELAQEAEASGSTDIIVAQGEAEKNAIETTGELAAVNPKKVDESEPTAVVTK